MNNIQPPSRPPSWRGNDSRISPTPISTHGQKFCQPKPAMMPVLSSRRPTPSAMISRPTSNPPVLSMRLNSRDISPSEVPHQEAENLVERVQRELSERLRIAGLNRECHGRGRGHEQPGGQAGHRTGRDRHQPSRRRCQLACAHMPCPRVSVEKLREGRRARSALSANGGEFPVNGGSRPTEVASPTGSEGYLSSPRRSWRYNSSDSLMMRSASSGPSMSSMTTCLCSSTL